MEKRPLFEKCLLRKIEKCPPRCKARNEGFVSKLLDKYSFRRNSFRDVPLQFLMSKSGDGIVQRVVNTPRMQQLYLHYHYSINTTQSNVQNSLYKNSLYNRGANYSLNINNVYTTTASPQSSAEKAVKVAATGKGGLEQGVENTEDSGYRNLTLVEQVQLYNVTADAQLTELPGVVNRIAGLVSTVVEDRTKQAASSIQHVKSQAASLDMTTVSNAAVNTNIGLVKIIMSQIARVVHPNRLLPEKRLENHISTRSISIIKTVVEKAEAIEKKILKNGISKVLASQAIVSHDGPSAGAGDDSSAKAPADMSVAYPQRAVNFGERAMQKLQPRVPTQSTIVTASVGQGSGSTIEKIFGAGEVLNSIKPAGQLTAVEIDRLADKVFVHIERKLKLKRERLGL